MAKTFLSKDYIALPEHRRLFILSALMERTKIRWRIREHHNNGARAAYQTACFISDTVSRYLSDLHRGVHTPIEDPDIFS